MTDTSIPQKRCTKCGIEKPATKEFFHQDRQWLKNKCKECVRNHLGSKNRRVDPHVGLPDGYKRCRHCTQVFVTVDGFHVNKHTKDGYGAWCKECSCKKSNDWREQNPIRHKIAISKWQEKNKEYVKAYRKNKYSRQTAVDKNRDYRHRNPEKAQQNNRDWRNRNRDKVRLSTQLSSQRRRARLKNLPYSFETTDWLKALDYWSDICAVCGSNQELHADHWIPLNSDDCPGTIPKNIVPLCALCNRRKAAKLPREWLIENSPDKAQEIFDKIQDYFNQL